MTPREFLDYCAARKITVSVRNGRLILKTAEGRADWRARTNAYGIEDEIIAALMARTNVVPFRPRATQATEKRPKRDFRAALARAREAAMQPRDDGGNDAA